MTCKLSSFLYHEVTNTPETTGFQRKSALPYKHTLQEFEKNIKILSNKNIKLINEVEHESNKKYVTISFDDGGKSNLQAAQILEKHNIKAHFFITTSFIGTPGFMTEKDIVSLFKKGHIIGSHTHTHPDIFYNLSENEMFDEWKHSKRILENILQSPVYCASVPGGEMDNKTETSALKSGYKYLFTSEPTFIPWKNKTLICIGRVCPKKGTPLQNIHKLANLQGYAKEKCIRLIKTYIKKAYYPIKSLYENLS